MTEFSLTNHPYSQAIEELKEKINTEEVTSYCIDFKSEYANSKIIRDFVGEIFQAFHITHPWHGRFILITDELINNAIEHGSREGDMNRCIITAGKDAETGHFNISVEVHDTGNGEKIELENLEKLKSETGNSDEVYL